MEAIADVISPFSAAQTEAGGVPCIAWEGVKPVDPSKTDGSEGVVQ